MNNNGFLITLPSDDKLSILLYNNTQSNYTTLLKNTIKFDIDYEVALVELFYSQTISFKIGTITLKSDNAEQKIDVFHKEGQDINSIISTINNSFGVVNFKNNNNEEKQEDFTKKIVFVLNKNTNKINMTVDNKKFKVDIKGEILKDLLSLPAAPTVKTEEINIFKTINFVNVFYIYTDIIKEQYVGSKMSRSLRSVQCSGNSTLNYGDYVCVNFGASPQYKPLAKTEIREININIRDAMGDQIHFKDIFAKVIAVLHFRPINGL